MNMKTNYIHQGDCIEVMKTFEDNSIDTIITDPPYGLEFMGKEWDSPSKMAGQKAHNNNMVGALAKGGTHTRGYASVDMSLFQEWNQNWAKEALRVAKPGATLLCFGGTRTYHRMACAVEDAGWILKDCIMWLYGSGFPKATDISKQLDKGHKRKVLGYKEPFGREGRKAKQNATGDIANANSAISNLNKIEEPATDEAKLWNGWKSHGLKPAYEPILVCMKPNEGSYAENALKHKVSGLNIDGGRVGFQNEDDEKESKGKNQHAKYPKSVVRNSAKNGIYQPDNRPPEDYNPTGRFPANIILECICDEVIEGKEIQSGYFPAKRGKSEYFGLDEKKSERVGKVMDKAQIHTNPDCPCYMLDEQSGDIKGWSSQNNSPTNVYGGSSFHASKTTLPKFREGYNDKGGASRFFYCAKASKGERNAGLEGFEETKTNDGRQKEIDNAFQRGSTERKNHHPTVKPLALMEYLCTLTKTPTGGIVLDMFAGSGTTLIAAKNTGRDYIGIEREKEYVEIAEARIKGLPNKLF